MYFERNSRRRASILILERKLEFGASNAVNVIYPR